MSEVINIGNHSFRSLIDVLNKSQWILITVSFSILVIIFICHQCGFTSNNINLFLQVFDVTHNSLLILIIISIMCLLVNLFTNNIANFL